MQDETFSKPLIKGWKIELDKSLSSEMRPKGMTETETQMILLHKTKNFEQKITWTLTGSGLKQEFSEL